MAVGAKITAISKNRFPRQKMPTDVGGEAGFLVLCAVFFT